MVLSNISLGFLKAAFTSIFSPVLVSFPQIPNITQFDRHKGVLLPQQGDFQREELSKTLHSDHNTDCKSCKSIVLDWPPKSINNARASKRVQTLLKIKVAHNKLTFKVARTVQTLFSPNIFSIYISMFHIMAPPIFPAK